jgi:hypothetical protein
LGPPRYETATLAWSHFDTPGSFGHTHHTYYNIACIHAVLGETETPMAWLERTVNSGFACWPFFRVDPYLESLREKPVFK